MTDFDGKSLLLSGASGAIAREIARQFFDAGANLALGDLDSADLGEFAATLDPLDSEFARSPLTQARQRPTTSSYTPQPRLLVASTSSSPPPVSTPSNRSRT